MAKTMKCKTCGEQISKKAKQCPHCGHDYSKKSGGMGIFSLLIITGIIFAVAIPKVDDSASQSASTTSYTPKKTPSQKKAEAAEDKKFIEIGKMLEERFKSKEEKTAKDAVFNEDTKTLSIGVYDDKSNRDGYAQYACLTAKEMGLNKRMYIKIVDYGSILRGGEWKKLGSTMCRPEK